MARRETMPRPVVLGHDPHSPGAWEDYSDHTVIARHGKHVYDSSLDSWSAKEEFALLIIVLLWRAERLCPVHGT